MKKPEPTYRIVDVDTGKELKPYQTYYHMMAFLDQPNIKKDAQYVDSHTLNLHTVYVSIPAKKEN